MRSARVIGAGLSGLAAAWRLTEAGFDVEIVEASARAGGLIATHRTPEGLVEEAANAFLWTETTERWFVALGVVPVFPLRDSRRRFIFRGGSPRRWPLGIGDTTVLAARAAAAWTTRRLRPTGDESVSAWSDRVLGASATRWLVSPALQGIYAAPADRLVARAVLAPGSGRRSRGRRRSTLVVPQGGMGELIGRLVERLTERRVTFAFGSLTRTIDASVPTVIATGARSAATLVSPHAPSLGAALSAIAMTSTLSVTAFYEPHASDVRGFGVLFPRGVGVEALGVLFNADIFPGRGPARSETWIHGALEAGSLPADRDIASTLARDRAVLTQRSAVPVSMHVHRQLESLPVYDGRILEAQQRLSELPPWLALSGNYLGRLGVAKLLDVASEAADRITGAVSPRECS